MLSPRPSSLWPPFRSGFGPSGRSCSSCSVWLSWLVWIAVLCFGAPRAHAQVFRPRTGKAATTKTPPAAANRLAATKPSATGATAKPGVKATPARRALAKKKRNKPRADDDTVVIDDDDDDGTDVKITDD